MSSILPALARRGADTNIGALQAHELAPFKLTSSRPSSAIAVPGSLYAQSVPESPAEGRGIPSVSAISAPSSASEKPRSFPNSTDAAPDGMTVSRRAARGGRIDAAATSCGQERE